MANQHGTTVISTSLTYGELADLIIAEYQEAKAEASKLAKDTRTPTPGRRSDGGAAGEG